MHSLPFFGNRRTQPVKTHRSIVFDFCWLCAYIKQGQCVPAVYQHRQTQVRPNYFSFLVVSAVACCIMSHFGRLEEFDCSSTDVDSYFERLHAFYRANNVHDNTKVDVFLSVVGCKTYQLLKSLLAPTLPSNKTMDEQYQTPS